MSQLNSTIFDPYGDVLLVLSKPALAAATDQDLANGGDEQLESDTISLPQTQTLPVTKEVEFKVSSRHLALASPVFHVMFDGGFKEKIDADNTQPQRVPLPDDDHDAMIILLDILHGLTRSVPRTVEKEMFVRLAVLIDKYDIFECVEVYTDMWFDDLWLRRDLSPPDIPGWIFVCWAFRKSIPFGTLTRAAALECTFPFNENGLPLPESLAKHIEADRALKIRCVLDNLQETLDRYIGGDPQCTQEHCDTHVLGNLIRQLKAKDLFPLPEATALGMSLKDLFSRVRTMELISYCDLRGLDGGTKCVLKSKLEDNLWQLEGEKVGLRLKDYVPKKR